jgi:hypothetical protein
MNTPLKWAIALVCLALVACGEDSTQPPFDIAGLTMARTAVPDMDSVSAASPGEAESGQPLLGEQALYPMWTRGLVTGVNRTVGDMVRILDFVVALDPTRYEEDTKTYWWGPYPNEDGPGHIALYVRDEGTDADFRYAYAFIRGDGTSLDDPEVVLFGATTPNGNGRGHGKGVMVWDFEGNRAFDEAHGVTPTGPTGRFAALFDRRMEDGGEHRVVYAVFRNFGEDDSESVNLDYFYGNIRGDGHKLRFINYRGQFDVYDGDDDPETNEPTQNENNDVRMVFLDGGMGRAQAVASGGDLENDNGIAAFAVHECWDDRIRETYLAQAALDADNNILWGRELGEVDDCGPVFKNELAELNVPSLDNIDNKLRAALDELATNGAPRMR